MKKSIIILCFAISVLLSFHTSISAQCGDDPIDPALEIAFDELVEASEGVTYLALFNGDTPKPNACGLNPTNPIAEWTGWGGPLDHDNMSIGEGVGTRNLITIAGVRYERGIGTHAVAKLVYDLSGGSYTQFKAVGGVDDEKTCGTVQFTFLIDGAEVFATENLTHGDPEGAEIEFDIPGGAKELTIQFNDAGDGVGCDHADLGDARLLGGAAVSPEGSLSRTWGSIKNTY